MSNDPVALDPAVRRTCANRMEPRRQETTADATRAAVKADVRKPSRNDPRRRIMGAGQTERKEAQMKPSLLLCIFLAGLAVITAAPAADADDTADQVDRLERQLDDIQRDMDRRLTDMARQVERLEDQVERLRDERTGRLEDMAKRLERIERTLYRSGLDWYPLVGQSMEERLLELESRLKEKK